MRRKEDGRDWLTRGLDLALGWFFWLFNRAFALGTGAYTIDYSYAGSTNFEDAAATATLDVTYGILVLSDQKAAKKA